MEEGPAGARTVAASPGVLGEDRRSLTLTSLSMGTISEE